MLVLPPDTFYEKNNLINFETWFLPLSLFYEETILNDFKNQLCRLAHVTKKPI